MVTVALASLTLMTSSIATLLGKVGTAGKTVSIANECGPDSVALPALSVLTTTRSKFCPSPMALTCAAVSVSDQPLLFTTASKLWLPALTTTLVPNSAAPDSCTPAVASAMLMMSLVAMVLTVGVVGAVVSIVKAMKPDATSMPLALSWMTTARDLAPCVVASSKVNST